MPFLKKQNAHDVSFCFTLFSDQSVAVCYCLVLFRLWALFAVVNLAWFVNLLFLGLFLCWHGCWMLLWRRDLRERERDTFHSQRKYDGVVGSTLRNRALFPVPPEGYKLRLRAPLPPPGVTFFSGITPVLRGMGGQAGGWLFAVHFKRLISQAPLSEFKAFKDFFCYIWTDFLNTYYL